MGGSWAIPGGWLLHSAAGGGLLLLLAWVLVRRTRQPARRQWLGDWGVAAALLAAACSLGPAWFVVSLGLPTEEAAALATDSEPPTSIRPLSPEPIREGEAPAEPALPEGKAPAKPARQEPRPPTPQGEETRPEGGQGFAGNALFAPEAGPLVAASDPPARDAAEAMAPRAEPAAEPAAVRADPARPPSPPRRWPAWLGLAYVLGAAFFLGRWLLGHVALWRLVYTSEPAPRPVCQVGHSMARGMRRPPRLLLSRRLCVPLSFGVWRPTVILPANLCADGGPGLRWALAHELTHLQRRDPWSCLLFGLGQVVYYYVPWFWWLRRQVRLCQEYIADAAAACQAGAAEDYAQFLLSLTARPAVPRGAFGVSGNTSDLFRRVTMLLQEPIRVERRCPRLWSLAAAAGLLAVALVVSGIGLRADAALTPLPDDGTPAKKKEDRNKKDQAQKTADDIDSAVRKALQDLPPGAARDRIERQVRDAMDRARQQMRQVNKDVAGMGRDIRAEMMMGRFGWPGGDARLGARLEKPSAVLADQLDLPKGEGLVIEQVQKGSAAAKAGLKENDILLELNGKAVPSDQGDFARLLNGIKADKAVNAVVLRKGKKEIIKGLSLPEAKAAAGMFGGMPGMGGMGMPGMPMMPMGRMPGMGGMPGMPGGMLGGMGPGGMMGGAPPGAAMGPAGGNGVMTTMFRTDDRFTGRHQEGNLVISVSGTVAEGKAKLDEIHVQDGNATHTYAGVDKVPARYRDKVKSLVDMSEKNSVKIEIKTPSGKKKPSGTLYDGNSKQ